MTKITEQQLNSIVLNISSLIETETDITITADDLYALNDWTGSFLQDKFNVEVLEEEEEFVLKNFLAIGAQGTHRSPYGVVAFPKDVTQTNELHGCFDSEQEARDYIMRLRKEYEDYRYFSCCRIEMPGVGNLIQAIDKVGDMLYRQDAKP